MSNSNSERYIKYSSAYHTYSDKNVRYDGYIPIFRLPKGRTELSTKEGRTILVSKYCAQIDRTRLSTQEKRIRLMTKEEKAKLFTKPGRIRLNT